MATRNIYCNLQELQHLPDTDDYLYHNYGWKHHPAWQHIMVLSFNADNADDAQEAMAVYHELWHFRHDLPSLIRDWN